MAVETTIPLPRSSFASGLANAFVKQDSEFIAPNPFEIPDTGTLKLGSPSGIVIEFGYSNRERPESHDRRGAPDGSVRVLLGDKTKKILRLSFADRAAFERCLQANRVFDQHALLSEGCMSNRAIAALDRNAMVISAILGSIPEELLEKLRSYVTASPTKHG